MPQFFNNNQAVPYVRLETDDGVIKLGINEPLSSVGNYNDVIGLENVSLSLGDDFVKVDATIEILYGTWKRWDFEDLIQRIVEEPYRTQSQLTEGEDPAIAQRGRWILQFGWRTPDGDDVLTPEINLRTTQNDVIVQPERYGSLTIRKTMIYEPTTILNQVMAIELTRTREKLLLLASARDETNESQISITPEEIFKLLVEDVNRITPEDEQTIDLNTFHYIGSNPYNGITGEKAFEEWITKPLINTSSLLKILDDDATTLSVRHWLRAWLKENGLSIIYTPLRAVDGSKLSWVVRFADANKALDKHESIEYTGFRQKPSETYRKMWLPKLSTLNREGIVNSATFTIAAGQTSASIRAIRESLGLDRPRAAGENTRPSETSEKVTDTRTPQNTSDTQQIDSDIRSAFYEILKAPDKRGTVALMGQPQLSVMDILDIDVGNPLFNGAYNVLSVTHEINASDYVTTVQMIQVTAQINEVSGVEQ
jgi:hypothetical protein